MTRSFPFQLLLHRGKGESATLLPELFYLPLIRTWCCIPIIITLICDFNERTNTLLYKSMYLSHFILDVSVVCERWLETGTNCYTDPTSSPDHNSTSSASCSTRGRWGPQPSVCKLALTLAFLSPTNSTAAGTCLYSFIKPTCFQFFFRLFTQVHLLIDGSVKGQYISKEASSTIFESLVWLDLELNPGVPENTLTIMPIVYLIH